MKKKLLFLIISFAGMITASFIQSCAYDDYYERGRFYDDGGYYGDRSYYGDRYDRREYREYRRDGDDEGNRRGHRDRD